MSEEEIFWYRRFNVPPSTWAPITRLKYLFGFTTGVSIWWKKHAISEQSILSFIHPDHSIPVIKDDEWIKEEFLQGKSIDPNRPFFPQIEKLIYQIPYGAMRDNGSNIQSIAVDMINSQNCYMTFGGAHCKDVWYISICHDCERSLDTTNGTYSSDAFFSNHLANSHNIVAGFQSIECLSSAFIFDCRNCEYCFGATNKRNRKYLWWNEQLSKEEWEKRRQEINLSCFSVFSKCWQIFFKLIEEEAKWPKCFSTASETSTGEYLYKCTRCFNGYWLKQSTDVFSCWFCDDFRDSAFCTWTGWGGGSYFSNNCINMDQIRFCDVVWYSSNMEYCFNCHDCEYCFGCVGLKKKRFCILNKQYKEEEYWLIVDELKIKMLERGEYGRFFPADFSPSGFEFSMGNLLLGYTKIELESFGVTHLDSVRGMVFAPQQMDTSQVINIETLPDALEEINSDHFVNKPLLDKKIERLFSVTESEFGFYQTHKLPFPREHFLSRIQFLLRTSNIPISKQTICSYCKKSITYYENQIFQKHDILCRSCYLKYLEENG